MAYDNAPQPQENGRPVVLSLWRGLIPRPRVLRSALILAEVAARHDLTPAILKGKSRARHIVWARQEAMAELRDSTPLSLLQIGRVLGGRDHSTVAAGLRAHAARRIAGVI